MAEAFDIAVLGPIPFDRITTYQGERIEKFGCAIYTTAALSALMRDRGRILPVAHVRKGELAAIRELLAALPGVDVDHVTADADQGDVITLRYVDQNQRIERQTGFMNPITADDIVDLMAVDAFVCVPITDFEVPLGTLQAIKAESDALIVFDAHGPTNCCTRHGERALKFWVERDLWLPYIDILKMNRDEAGCCWFGNDYDLETLQNVGELPMDQLPKLAAHCLERGVKALYVTLDEHGCAVYFKDPAGRMREHVVKRVAVDQVVDTTGCGDSFAAGLAFGYLHTKDFVKACWYGNAMGAQRCTGSGLAVYRDLDDTERQIADTYVD